MRRALKEWMLAYRLDSVKAARYLHCLPQNVLWIVRGTARPHLIARLLPRLRTQQDNMKLRRCVIGRMRAKNGERTWTS